MNKSINKRVLIVAAHPDDEVLGCGATISKYVESGSEVRVYFLAEGVTSRFQYDEIHTPNVQMLSEKRNNNAIKALKHLGLSEQNIILSKEPCCRLDTLPQLEIIKSIERQLDDYKPDCVFTHWPHDTNIDHRIAFQSVITACRPVRENRINLLASFEVLSSTEWNNSKPFHANYFEDVSSYMDKKIESMNLYGDEMRKPPHPRSEEVIKSLACYRGSQVGFRYAEAFNIIRMSN